MKKYPFNVEKHAHDLEFQSNRAFCIMHDMESGEIPFDESEYDRLETLRNDLQDAMVYFNEYPISFLPGKQYGVAKAATVWAAETRAATAERRKFQDVNMYA